MLREMPATGFEDGEGSGAQQCRNFWKLENPFYPGTSEKKTLAFFSFSYTAWLLGSWFPDRGWNLWPLQCPPHWTAREVPEEDTLALTQATRIRSLPTGL